MTKTFLFIVDFTLPKYTHLSIIEFPCMLHKPFYWLHLLSPMLHFLSFIEHRLNIS